VPPGKVFTVHGRGYGHGHGMSQWGAYGAVKARHRTAAQVLHFYYPHTTEQKFSTRHKVHVLVSAVSAPVRGYLEVEPAPGLTVKPAGADPVALPRKTANHRRITGWRLQRNGTAIDLRDFAHRHWHTMQSVGVKATFTDTAQELEVNQPGKTAAYRGAFAAEVRPSTFEAINILPMETYLRGVVAAEMPASWPQQALQAQSIASRSYAWYEVRHPKASWFDVYGDTRDQAYGGVASENPRTTKAIDATAGQVLVDSTKHPIFAQFASADGGWTVAGGQSYLPAKHDPYDGAVPNTEHAWTTSVPASTLQSAYPSIGRLANITITRRDGNGKWGGRVLGLTLHGDAGSVDLTGSDLQFALGLRSPWFRPVPPPGAPRALKANVAHRVLTVQWKAPAAAKGAAAVSGYRVRVSPDKRRKDVSASARQVSFGKLASGSHTVTLTALSSAGHSHPVTVVVETGHK
jgi:stage II sporulation protein D